MGNRLVPNSQNSRVLLSIELRNTGMKLDHLIAVIKENHRCEGIEHCIVSLVYSFQMLVPVCILTAHPPHNP